MQKILIIGGGGHAGVLMEIISMSGQFDIAGIIDSNIEAGIKVSGIPVLGNDNLLDELYKKGILNACIAVGSIVDTVKRKALFERIKQSGFTVPSLSHPKAIISNNAKISEGAQVIAGAIIQTGSFIGENTIINSGAIIEHDCNVGSHVHICPGAVISGGCELGEGTFIGAGATIIQGIKIGKDVMVSAGAVVIKDIPDGARVKGVPAK